MQKQFQSAGRSHVSATLSTRGQKVRCGTTATHPVTLLIRPKSGKTTVANAYILIKRVHDRLRPDEAAVRQQLGVALQVLKPYKPEEDAALQMRTAA